MVLPQKQTVNHIWAKSLGDQQTTNKCTQATLTGAKRPLKGVEEKKKREHGCVHFAEAGDAFIFLKTKLYYCALHKEVR